MTITPSPILFDLDGTLVDSARSIAVALNAVAKARGGDAVDASFVRPLVSQGVETLVATALAGDQRNIKADIAAFRCALSTIIAEPTDLYPGAAEAIKLLADAGHPMAIVSNKPESLCRKLLGEVDLLSYFRTLVGGDSCSASKPSPIPLMYALATIAPSASAADAILVGDSDIDGHAARSAGCAFILFDGGYGPVSEGAYPVAGRFEDFARLAQILT